MAHTWVGHADIGISLPGAGEDPRAPIYVEGKLSATRHGPPRRRSGPRSREPRYFPASNGGPLRTISPLFHGAGSPPRYSWNHSRCAL